MSDWLISGGSSPGNLCREIKTQLGIRDHRGEINLDNPLVQVAQITGETVKDIPRKSRVVLKALVEVPISLGRDARELVNSGAEALGDSAKFATKLITDTPVAQGISAELDNKVIKTEEPFLRLAEKFDLNSKATKSRRLAHLINPVKPSINIVDILKAVETGKLIPTLVINNSEPTESKTDDDKLQKSKEKIKEKNETLFLETPNGEHKLTLSYKPPSKDSELGELNIQFKESEHKHLLDNCTEPQFQRFVDFLVDHPKAQKIENNSQLTK